MRTVTDGTLRRLARLEKRRLWTEEKEVWGTVGRREENRFSRQGDRRDGGVKLKKIKKICDGMLKQLWREGKFYPELADKNYHAFISGFRAINKIIEEPTETKDET